MSDHAVEGTVPSQWWLDLKIENQRLRDELLWFYTTGINQLVHFNITDQERIRRANVALSYIENALNPDADDEGITPIVGQRSPP